MLNQVCSQLVKLELLGAHFLASEEQVYQLLGEVFPVSDSAVTERVLHNLKKLVAEHFAVRVLQEVLAYAEKLDRVQVQKHVHLVFVGDLNLAQLNVVF